VIWEYSPVAAKGKCAQMGKVLELFARQIGL
jgi:hypothetical protein